MARQSTSTPFYMDAAGNAVMAVPTPFALSMWYHGVQQGNFTYWVSKLLLPGEHPSWGFQTNGAGNLRLIVGTGSSSGQLIVSPGVAGATAYDNAWHHVLGYYDGANIGLYFDGVDQGSNAASAAIVYDNSKALYLFSFDGTQLYTQGEMEQLVVWNAIPTAAEIAALAAGAPPEVVRGRSIACMWALNGMEPEIGKVGLQHLTNHGVTAAPFSHPPRLKFPDQGD